MKTPYLSMKLSGRRYATLAGALALDGFQLKSRLGQGRFGECYTVSRNGNDDVLKIFNPNDVKRRKKKLARESGWLGEINHPAIPKLIKTIDRDGFYGLIMEKLPGNSLEELLDWDYDFGRVEMITIMTQLLEVLGYLASRKISHRDIKTSNILWTGRKLSLIDFGSARHIAPFNSRFNPDFWGTGDVFMRLASACPELSPNPNALGIDQLNLDAAEKYLIKRLLYLEKPYADFDEVQKCFTRIFL